MEKYGFVFCMVVVNTENACRTDHNAFPPIQLLFGNLVFAVGLSDNIYTIWHDASCQID